MLNGDSNENGKNKNNRSKDTIKRAAKKRAFVLEHLCKTS